LVRAAFLSAASSAKTTARQRVATKVLIINLI
jgi:hypothetical protein